MTQIFLSHASFDKPFARRLAADLESNGVTVWIDEKSIQVGDSIRRSIENGLQNCDFAVVVISKDSLSRPWVMSELDALFSIENNNGQKIILPVLIEDADIPLLLQGKKYADFRSDYETGLGEILNAVNPEASAWDFLCQKLDVELEFQRIDGSKCTVRKKHSIVAQRDGLTEFEEDWTADGDIKIMEASPGTIDKIWKEGATTYQRTRFSSPLAKGKAIEKLTTVCYTDAFPSKSEYWNLYQYFPSQEYILTIKFLKSRPPKKFWVIEKRGADRRHVEGVVSQNEINGKITLVVRIIEPKMLADYQLHWDW